MERIDSLLARSRKLRSRPSACTHNAAPTATVVFGSSIRLAASRNGYFSPTRYWCMPMMRCGGTGVLASTMSLTMRSRDGRPDSSSTSQSYCQTTSHRSASIGASTAEITGSTWRDCTSSIVSAILNPDAPACEAAASR